MTGVKSTFKKLKSLAKKKSSNGFLTTDQARDREDAAASTANQKFELVTEDSSSPATDDSSSEEIRHDQDEQTMSPGRRAGLSRQGSMSRRTTRNSHGELSLSAIDDSSSLKGAEKKEIQHDDQDEKATLPGRRGGLSRQGSMSRRTTRNSRGELNKAAEVTCRRAQNREDMLESRRRTRSRSSDLVRDSLAESTSLSVSHHRGSERSAARNEKRDKTIRAVFDGEQEKEVARVEKSQSTEDANRNNHASTPIESVSDSTSSKADSDSIRISPKEEALSDGTGPGTRTLRRPRCKSLDQNPIVIRREQSLDSTGHSQSSRGRARGVSRVNSAHSHRESSMDGRRSRERRSNSRSRNKELRSSRHSQGSVGKEQRPRRVARRGSKNEIMALAEAAKRAEKGENQEESIVNRDKTSPETVSKDLMATLRSDLAPKRRSSSKSKRKNNSHSRRSPSPPRSDQKNGISKSSIPDDGSNEPFKEQMHQSMSAIDAFALLGNEDSDGTEEKPSRIPDLASKKRSSSKSKRKNNSHSRRSPSPPRSDQKNGISKSSIPDDGSNEPFKEQMHQSMSAIDAFALLGNEDSDRTEEKPSRIPASKSLESFQNVLKQKKQQSVSAVTGALSGVRNKLVRDGSNKKLLANAQYSFSDYSSDDDSDIEDDIIQDVVLHLNNFDDEPVPLKSAEPEPIRSIGRSRSAEGIQMIRKTGIHTKSKRLVRRTKSNEHVIQQSNRFSGDDTSLAPPSLAGHETRNERFRPPTRQDSATGKKLLGDLLDSLKDSKSTFDKLT